MNVFLKTAGVLVVALVAAILIVPSFVDWNRYKSQITGRIEELTGRKLEIAGDVSFAVLPAPAFSAGGLHFANIEGGQATDLVSIESLDIRVAFLPLIGGRIQVESIALNNPVLALEVLADGRANWVFDTKAEDGPADGSPRRQSLIDVSFEEVLIENGSISYNDAGTERFHRLDQVSATVSASSLEGPFSMAGTAAVRQTPLSFEVLIGNLKSSRAVPISFSVGLNDRTAKLGFAGWASELGPEARLNGRLTAEGANLSETIEGLSAVADVSLDNALFRHTPLQTAFSVEAQVVASAREGRLRNLVLQLGDSAATGAFHITSESGGEFEGELNIPQINLDNWLTNDDREAELAAEDAVAPATGAGAGADASSMMSDFSLPPDLVGTFKISIGGINYQGGVVRQLGIGLRMGDGRLGVENASALLPGGSSVDLTGVLAADAGKPRFSGRLNGSSDNLRGLLTWLDVDVGTVPFDRLTRLSYSSSIDASPEVFQAYGIDMTMDTLHAKGGVSIALQERLALGLDLTIDALDLDAYIGNPVGTSKSGAAGSRGPSRVVKLKQHLAILDDFDANLRLNVGRFVWRGAEITKLLIDGGVYGGEVTLKELSVGDYLGAGGALAGTARELSRKPYADLRLDFDLRTQDTLKNIVGDILPKSLGRLGVGKGSLSLKGDEGRVAVNLNAGFSGTDVAVKGAVVAPTSAPAIDLTISVANGSTAKLIKQFAFPLDPPGPPDDGPVAAALTIRGQINELNLKTTVNVGGASLSIGGKVENVFTEPSYAFELDLKGDDLKKLVRGLGVDFQPAAANLGGIDMTLGIEGDYTRASLTRLKGAVGPVDFSGEARVRLTGDRPRIEGTLKTGEVVMDLFLPAAASTARAGRAQAGGKPKDQWSKEPFDLAFLRDFDGELRLEAPGVVVGAYDFRSVRAVLAVQDGTATVKPFSARLFDGDAVLDVRLRARKIPTLDLQLSLTNADVSRAMRATAGLDAVTGRAGVSGEFTAAGRNQFDMIASLAGGARISAREGEIRGIDLQGLSRRLKKLDNLSDVLDVVTGSMSGGKTAYRSIEGAIEVAKGVVRTTDVRTDIDAIDTIFASEMDLVNWTMDTSAQFHLIDHPRAPPVGVDLRGPIDNPRRDLKTRKLESYLTKRLGAAVLKNLIGKKQKPADPVSDPMVPSPVVERTAPAGIPEIPTPEDVLRDLLTNLP